MKSSHSHLDTLTTVVPASTESPFILSTWFNRVWKNDKLIGYIAISIAVTIWASFALSMRSIGLTSLTSADVMLIRFGIPALILLPFISPRLPFFKSLLSKNNLMMAAMVVLGAGLPFYFLTAMGAKATSATHVGALVAGTAPLSTILIKSLIYKLPIHKKLAMSLAIICLGVVLMVSAMPGSLGNNSIIGIMTLLLASICWGFNTVGLQKLKTDPISLAIILVYPSVIGIGFFIMLGLANSNLLDANMNEIVPFVLVQGLAVGIVSTLTYSLAIQRLGSSLSATIGSLAPALACMMAIPILGEVPNILTIIAVLVIVCGVILVGICTNKK